LESRVYDTCIAVDQHVGDHVLGPEQRFHVVPIGVDTEKFQPARQLDLRRQIGIADDRLVIVFNSSLVRPRMPERVIQAFAQARRQCPQLSLLNIADGTRGIIDELRMLAESLQVAGDVYFTGYVSYGIVQKYINIGDIGLAYVPIIPQFNSQPPLKTAEFLACGLPTLATHTLGNALWIRDNDNGLLISDDPTSIAAGMLRLARDQALREQLAGAARPSILQHDWSRIVRERLLPVYTQALEA
jgi:glycosyltransferase involved in cell wall biosynthesis